MTIIIILLIFLFGGCGVSMDLFHSEPQPLIEATPTPSAEGGVCTLTIRQPPPNSPTRMPSAINAQQVGTPMDVHVAYCMNLGTLVVGDEWRLRVRAIDMGLAVYYLTLTSDNGESLTIRYNPALPSDSEFSSNLSSMTIVSATTYNQWEAIFTLTANAVDVVQVSLYASGEVHYGYPGPASWTVTPTETFFLAINE